MATLSRAHRHVFLAWGIVIAALVLITLPFPPEDRPAAVTLAHWAIWVALYATFLIVFWLASRAPLRWPMLACETAIVLAIVSTRPALGLEGALFAAVAFQLGEHRPAVALAWMAGQSAAMIAILDTRFGLDHALSVVGVYFPFQLLAWYTSRVLARESAAREELVAAHELLAVTSRSAERLRISRELHDVFGHRLAALSLNLEVAARVPTEQRAKFVERAHDGAKGLLQDVREVVANLRRGDPIEVGEVLRLMIRDVPQPEIHLACPDALAIADPEAAHVVLRCAQEIVTNSIKHSSGEHLWIELRSLPSGVELIAADDGRGATDLREGNGLRGMRERLAAFGGTLDIDHEHGFRVRLFVPEVAR